MAYTVTPLRSNVTVRPADDERMLAEAYLRIDEEALTGAVFGGEAPSLSDFLAARKALPAVACYVGERMVGLAWLNSMSRTEAEAKRADVSLAIFDEATSGAERLECGRQLLAWAFEVIGLDVVMALVPEYNRRAQMYLRCLGFGMFGPIPLLASWCGEPCGGWVGALTRKQWLASDGR